jgi:hypothetical protein
MLRTMMWSTIGLAMAAGGPFLYFTAADYLKTGSGPAAAINAITGGAASPKSVPEPESRAEVVDNPAVEGTAHRDLADVFRFNITPNWVMGQWPRVSTGMSQIQLVGYRVTLVTGIAPDDIAGALTYYFTPQQRLQRIAFQGTTGDARKLVAFLTGKFHFARRILNDPTLWRYEAPDPDGGEPQGVLQIQSAEIVRADEPYRRFRVSLTLERTRDEE